MTKSLVYIQGNLHFCTVDTIDSLYVLTIDAVPLGHRWSVDDADLQVTSLDGAVMTKSSPMVLVISQSNVIMHDHRLMAA